MRLRRHLCRALLACALLAALAALFTLYASRRAEAEFPARGKFVRADATTLHYLEAGSGKPIVLLHGAFGASQDYAATLFPLLSPTHQLVAFDRPGHGWSDRVAGGPNTPAIQARAIHAALRELHLERPVLLGFSYGGAVALSYALQFPRELSGLVLVNPAAHPWPAGPDAYTSIPRIPLLGPLFTHTLATPIALFQTPSSCAHSFAPVAVAPGFEDTSPIRLELTPARFAANCEDLHDLVGFLAEQSPRYVEIQTPTLLLASVEDEVTSFAIHSQALAREIPGAKLITFSPAGHQVLYSRSGEVARDVLDFLAEHGL